MQYAASEHDLVLQVLDPVVELGAPFVVGVVN